nr:phytosulfokine receptor 2 [Ipomoea batatas]GME19019.1 phytosulfokine receptor 2 [Ipomoea batatas]
MEPLLQQILVAIGGFFLLMIFTFAVVYKCRKEQAPRRAAPATELTSVTVGESGTLNRIDMGELVRATRDFSPDLLIGRGHFGLVYRARLSSGVHVAVKKLAPDAFQGFREFRAEMETLVKIQHENIVKILGYSAAGSDLVLIYEFVENGSLDQWLYDTQMKESQSHISTEATGTMGYMPPEYIEGCTKATKSGDIYSFGVLMMEIITGRRPINPFTREFENGYDISMLTKWVDNMMSQKRYIEMVDLNISRRDFSENDVINYFAIVTRCVSSHSKNRATINHVIGMLEQLA